MTPQAKTRLFLVAWVAAAVLYDLVALWCWGPDATVTRELRRWAQWGPWLLVVLGALLWHLFGTD